MGTESFHDQALREHLRTSKEFQQEIQTCSDQKLLELTASDGTGQAAVVESSRRLRVAIEGAEASIKHGSDSIDELTRRLIKLTWGLVVLTGLLAILSIPPTIETIKRLGWFGFVN
jgi:hypothetical protein